MITTAKLTAALTIAIAAIIAIGLSLSPGKAQSGPSAAPPAQVGELLLSYQTDDYQPLAVTNGILYGYGSVDLKHYLYAVNPPTGQLLWRFQTGGRVSAPTVANGLVYFRSADSFVYALYEETGEQLWRYRAVGRDISLSPLVSDGTVFVTAGRFIYALSANTGDEIWRYNPDETDSYPEIGFYAQEVYNGVLYVSAGYGSNYLLALDVVTGTLQWQYSEGYTGSALLVFDGVVYTSSYIIDGSTGRHLWDMDIGVAYYGPVSNGIVYGISGGVNAIDTVTGSILWIFPSEDGSSFFLPVVSKGIIYTASGNSVYALDADTSALQWRWAADEYTDGHPLQGFGMADGVAYVWTEKYVSEKAEYSVYAISTTETPPPTPRPDPTNVPARTPAPTDVPAQAPTPTIAPTRAPAATPTPRPTPNPGQPIISFHASKTSVATGDPVALTLSAANSIIRPEMTLLLVLQFPSGMIVTGEGLDDGCSVQCAATYQLSPGENRDFRLTAVSGQPGEYRIDSRMEWYFGENRENYGVQSESLTLNVIDRDPPNINLHANQTEVTLGEPIVLNLTAANPITNPQATLQLVLKAPSGWSVSGAGFAQSCTGQCIATYQIPPGGQQSININMLPNQPGTFAVTGDLTWYFGNDRETAGNKSVSVDLNVTPPAPTSTPIPAPAPSPTPPLALPPATQTAAPNNAESNGGCGAPANPARGDLAMLSLLSLPLLGLAGLKTHRRRRHRQTRPDSE